MESDPLSNADLRYFYGHTSDSEAVVQFIASDVPYTAVRECDRIPGQPTPCKDEMLVQCGKKHLLETFSLFFVVLLYMYACEWIKKKTQNQEKLQTPDSEKHNPILNSQNNGVPRKNKTSTSINPNQRNQEQEAKQERARDKGRNDTDQLDARRSKLFLKGTP